MKISRNWLQTFFDKPLPEVSDLVRGLTMHAFEIEETLEKGSDIILDVKVLPNRAHDCLSHYGIAKEVSAIFSLPLSQKPLSEKITPFPESNSFSVDIQSKKVKRFKVAVIKNVVVTESPKWLRECIEAMGGKSINNIVDITNFVMFEVGQPMHAFDADKLIEKDGGAGFIIRESKAGEKTTTLDGVDRVLPEGVILITDAGDVGKSILGIAGIKGGVSAEITGESKNIILEAATFDAQSIRKNAKLLNIRTDASVRFENDIAPELPPYAIARAVALIEELAKGEDFQVDGEVDFVLRPKNLYKLGVSLTEINNTLGTKLTVHEVQDILNRLNFPVSMSMHPIQDIVERAASLLGKPYKLGASVTGDAPELFDCSSFTSYVFAESGISIPRMSVDQYVYGDEVDETEVMAGDLLFANTGVGKIHTESVEFMKGTSIPQGIDHVGLCVGNGEVIHATGTANSVVKEKISESERFKKIVGYRRIHSENEPRFVVTVPFERLDLRCKEDLIEEVGRMYGLEHIESKLPQPLGKEPEINKEFYYAQKIREALVNDGYSEVYTYAMVDSGDVEIENPIASDKNFMRKDLKSNMEKTLVVNGRNAPLLGVNEIRLFEIGAVFTKKSQVWRVCVGTLVKNKTHIEEYSLEEAYEKYCKGAELTPDVSVKGGDVTYKKISPYPFALRDIAVFVPKDTEEAELSALIRKEAGELLVRCDLFDRFQKEDKVSYAYHLVFQSNERTLSEDELNSTMSKVESAIKEKGFIVR